MAARADGSFLEYSMSWLLMEDVAGSLAEDMAQDRFYLLLTSAMMFSLVVRQGCITLSQREDRIESAPLDLKEIRSLINPVMYHSRH